MRRWAAKLRAAFGRRSGLAEELREELDTHLEMCLQERAAPPETVRRQFGNRTLIQEGAREAWAFGWFETLLQDLRYAARTLWRSPGFTAMAVLSLALGIGANTAVFTVVDALMLRTLAVRSPEQLVIFDRTYKGESRGEVLPYQIYQRLRAIPDAFSGIAASLAIDRSAVALQPDRDLLDQSVRIGLVTGEYFSTLGVSALTGRALTPDDDGAPGAHPVAVISYQAWEHWYGLASDAVGRTLRIQNTTYTVVGVTPRAFAGEWVGKPVDLWIPTAMQVQVMPEVPNLERMNVRVIARLKPGIAASQVQAAGQVVLVRYLEEQAAGNQSEIADIPRSWKLLVEPAARGVSPQRQFLAQPLLILMVVVGLVLLIACANVANLLLARAAARQREMAVRLALGASALRLVRQLLTETMALAAMGGALGLWLAKWGTSALSTTVATGPMTFNGATTPIAVSLDLHPDLRILAFTAGLCLLTGFLFGLAPAIRVSHVSFAAALNRRGAGSWGSGQGFGLGKALVVSQVALSLFLMIGAGLFIQSLRNMKSQDLGLAREHLLLVWASPRQSGRVGPSLVPLYHTVQQRISELPGVVSASPTVYGVLDGTTFDGTTVTAEGYQPGPGDPPRAQWNIVGPRFFETMGIPLLAGREFTDRDTDTSPRVGIVNETMARFFFGNQNPVGRHFGRNGQPGTAIEIVGVARNAKQETPRRDKDRMLFYVPYRQDTGRLHSMCLVVRATGNPLALASRIRQEIRTIDDQLPVLKINTMEEQLDDVLVQERLIAALAGFFAALAVLLACLGLYGVISYTAARRTNEIGIRLAMGATRAAVLGMVLKETFVLVAMGLLIGVPATLSATRLISARLFGISPGDPLTIAAAAALLISVALVAGFLPAWRASKVDPMVALRYD
jgi:predicted permease